jgi:hypothetical protein
MPRTGSTRCVGRQFRCQTLHVVCANHAQSTICLTALPDGTLNCARSAIRKTIIYRQVKIRAQALPFQHQIYEVCKKAALCFGRPVLCTTP